MWKLTPIKVFGWLLVVFVVGVVVTYKSWGVSWDEEFYKDSGKFYISNFWADWQTVAKKIPEYHALTHGAVVDAVYYLPFRLGLPETFENLHLVKGLFGSLTLVWVFLALRGILGKKSWGPVVGVLLLMTYPRFLGDIFDNFMDGSAAMIYALEIWLVLTGQWLALGVVGAGGFSHRVALVIVPLMGAIKLGWKRLVIMAIVFYASLWVVDPYIRTYGLAGIDRKISMSADYFVYRGAQLFEGKYIFAKDLPWYYLPKWVLVTSPIGTLVLAGIGIVAGRGWKRMVLGGAVVIPMIGAVIMRPILYDGWRVFLFLSVPLVMLAAIGWQWLWERRKYVAVGLLVVTVMTVKSMIELHPYEYVYFNELVGGLKGAFGQYETDYWGKSNREAVLWFKENVADDPNQAYYIKTCATKHSATAFFGENMVWVPTLTEADYFICFTKYNQHEQVAESHTIHIVQRQGVPLNYIKRVRYE